MKSHNFEKLLEIVMGWKHLKIVKLNNISGAVKVAHIPKYFPQAYLHTYYKGLTNKQIDELENHVGKKFPKQYSEFLQYSNGINLFHEVSVYGLRFTYDRIGDDAIQPFDLKSLNNNLLDKIPKNWLAIGTYSYDASVIFIDNSKKTNNVFRCKKNEINILETWPDFWTWLLSEAIEISKKYGRDGYKLNSRGVK